MDKKTEAKLIEAARLAGIVISTEDANETLTQAMDKGSQVLVEHGHFHPMLEVVTRDTDGGTDKRVAILEGDFDDHQDKIRSLAAAGNQLGQELGKQKIIILQVTLLAEAWQCRTDPDTDEEIDRTEVLLAITHTWDGREGSLSRRIVRDTDDTPIGTSLSVDHPVTEKRTEFGLLAVFFTAFAIAGALVHPDIDPMLVEKAHKLEEELNQAIGQPKH